MNLYRHSFVIALIGLITGLALGVGYSYLTREPEQPTLSVPGLLTVSCVGGQAPRVIVTWPQRATTDIAGLERQTADGPWVRIYGQSTKVNSEGYEDSNVVFGSTYRYRLTFTTGDADDVAEILVSEASCISTL